jgi:TolB-like protein
MMYFDESQLPSKHKKKKVRAAWIGFIGRILGQIVGAVVSIAVGLMVVQRHQTKLEPAVTAAVQAAQQQPVRETSSKQDGEIVVAVLPLANFSADARDAYLADGLTEALITDLAQMRGLRVISRTSTVRYKDGEKSVPEIAQELGADVIVEGSVIKAGERVRVTAQLIDAASDEHIWARRFDEKVGDVLTLQTQIASAIAADVRDTVAPARPTTMTGAF